VIPLEPAMCRLLLDGYRSGQLIRCKLL
jgi:hypothetical protein